MANAHTEPGFNACRSYLKLLARMSMGPRLKGRVDASDIAQLTLLKAHQARHEYRGTNAAAMLAWLRRILVRTIADADRDMHRDKRDAALERSLDAAVEQSSCRLGAMLAVEQSSPSENAARGELLLKVVDAMERLPDAQREALVLKHCEGLSLADIAQRLSRTPASVASLLRRGLAQLRDDFDRSGN